MFYVHYREDDNVVPERPPVQKCDHEWQEISRDEEGMAKFGLDEIYRKCALCGAIDTQWEEKRVM